MAPFMPELVPSATDAVSVVRDPELALPLFGMPAAGRRDPRPGISGVHPDALATWLSDIGLPAWRGRQLADHVWSGRAGTFDEIHTLPKAARDALANSFRMDVIDDTIVRPADAGLTEKALHRLDD